MGWGIFLAMYTANVSLLLPGIVLILGAGFIFGCVHPYLFMSNFGECLLCAVLPFSTCRFSQTCALTADLKTTLQTTCVIKHAFL